jgi:chromatin modification-related protein EAF6
MSTALDQLINRKQTFEGELERIEDRLYELETAYLSAEHSQCGTVLKGFEGFLSSKDALRKRNRQLKPEDRSFSLCSVTSPATVELEQAMQDPVNDVLGVYGGRGKGKGKGFGKGNMPGKGSRR